VVGQRLPMRDGGSKARGEAVFAADVRLPNMAHAKLLASPHAHAEILSIDASAAEKMPGVHGVVTRADIPAVAGYDPYDRSHGFMARRFATYVGQPIAAVAADDPFIAEQALKAIRIEYRVLPTVGDMATALADDAVAVSHDPWPDDRSDEDVPTVQGNDAGHAEFQRGDVEAGWAEADVVVENAYRIPMLYQGYIEPHAVCAHWDRADHVGVWACVQSPFGARNMIMDVLGIPAGSITMRTTEVGGAFGAKDLGLFSPIAVLLAKKARRPVKLALARSDDMRTANPAPAVEVRLKMGATAEGRLTAVAGTAHVAVGAFRTYWGPASASVCGMILHKYRFSAFQLKAQDVFTNHVGFGSYRAPMALQAAYAIESLVDELSLQLGIDPIEFREKNLIREDQPGPTGREVPAHGGFEVLEALRTHEIWTSSPSSDSDDGLLRGKGMALGLWGSGAFPASAIAKIEKGGVVRIIIGQVDLTGSYTALAQIAADVLGISPERIVFGRSDTSRGPHASVSGGSSTIYSMGLAVQRATEDLRELILERGSQQLGLEKAAVRLDESAVVAIEDPEKRCDLATLYDLESHLFTSEYEPYVARGASGGDQLRESAPCFAGTAVQVAVHPATGRVWLERLVTAQDVGKAINPMSVEGQIHGAAVQGAGAALWEAMEHDGQGRPMNANLLDYRMPTTADMPRLESILVEVGGGDGPFGAKGVGEPPVIAPAAAIANAVADAIGVRPTEIPMTPERIWAKLRADA